MYALSPTDHVWQIYRSCQNVMNKHFMSVLSPTRNRPFISEQDIPSFEASLVVMHQEKKNNLQCQWID